MGEKAFRLLQKNGNLILKGDDTELIKEDFF
jgi:hypothetical protein